MGMSKVGIQAKMFVVPFVLRMPSSPSLGQACLAENFLPIDCRMLHGSPQAAAEVGHEQPVIDLLINHPTTPRTLAPSALNQTFAHSLGLAIANWRSCPEYPTRRAKSFPLPNPRARHFRLHSLSIKATPNKPHVAASKPRDLDDKYQSGTRWAVPNQAHDEDQQPPLASRHPTPRPPRGARRVQRPA
jgi:hypothetical protein